LFFCIYIYIYIISCYIATMIWWNKDIYIYIYIGLVRLKGSHNNNNNNNHDNVYGAAIMTEVIERVHPVHLMNADWTPQTKPIDLGRESAENWLLPSTSTIAIVIITRPVSWCSFTVPRMVKSWVNLDTALRSPCPRLYIAAAVAINTTGRGVIRTCVLSHRSQTR